MKRKKNKKRQIKKFNQKRGENFKDDLKMVQEDKHIRIIKYLAFTILMSWSPILVNCFVCSFFDLPIHNIDLYASDICFMVFILALTNLKDLLESNIIKTSNLFIIHIILNIMNIILSLLLIGILTFIEFSNISVEIQIRQHFVFIIAMYIMVAFLGMSVQLRGK